MSRPVIDYGIVAKAVEFYRENGYQYVEAPWLVSRPSINVTKPSNSRYFSTFRGELVASGEQSFLEIRDDLCPGRKYACATPCFRDETYGERNFPYFFKVELILPLWKTDDADAAVQTVLADASSFFRRYGTSDYPVQHVATAEGFDITLDDFELGSYGWREHNGFRWVYGTGVAEPRLSQALAFCAAEQKRCNDKLMASLEA